MISCRGRAAAFAAAAVLILSLLVAGAAGAQSLKVLPVNIQMSPGEKAATLTVTNDGNAPTAIQIRAYDWKQVDGKDTLTASSNVLASPPVATIAPGDSQVVRLVLRRPPEEREATYRILLDQIPPATEPGVIHMVLRLSIPIFAQPTTRAVPRLQFHIETEVGKIYLVGTNDGLRHEAIRNLELSTTDGRKLTPDSGASPYILAGATRRWAFAMQGMQPIANEVLRMTAQADSGKIDQQVRFAGIP